MKDITSLTPYQENLINALRGMKGYKELPAPTEEEQKHIDHVNYHVGKFIRMVQNTQEITDKSQNQTRFKGYKIKEIAYSD